MRGWSLSELIKDPGAALRAKPGPSRLDSLAGFDRGGPHIQAWVGVIFLQSLDIYVDLRIYNI